MNFILSFIFVLFPLGNTQHTIMKILNSTQMSACENCVSSPQFFVVAPGLSRENDRFYCLPYPPLKGILIVRHYILHVQDCSIPYVEGLYSASEMVHHKREYRFSTNITLLYVHKFVCNYNKFFVILF